MGSEGSQDVTSNGADDAGVINGFIQHFMDEAIVEEKEEEDELQQQQQQHHSSSPPPAHTDDHDELMARSCDAGAAPMNGSHAAYASGDVVALACFSTAEATGALITCVTHGDVPHSSERATLPCLKEVGQPEQDTEAEDLGTDADVAMEDAGKQSLPPHDSLKQPGGETMESAGSEDTEDAVSDSNEAAAAENCEPPKGDPAKVKKPLAPFLLFSKEQRPLVKRDHPDASFKDMNVLLGEKWKNVSNGEKKAYEARYQVDKEVYMKNLQNTVQEAKVPKKSESRSRRKDRDPDKPKHQITAFFAFGNDRRPALLAEKISVPEIGKILGDEWKNMDEEARCQYEKIAAQDKIRYATELEAYKKKKEEEALALKKQMEERKAEYAIQASKLYKQNDKMHLVSKLLKEDRSSQRKRSKIEDEPGKPKKPQTAYLLFGHEVRQAALKENPSLSFVDINTIVSTKWRELAEDEKQKWLNKSAAALEQYKSDLSDYYAKRRGATESSTGS